MVHVEPILSGPGGGGLGADSRAAERSGRVAPLPRTPHPWASAFCALCRMLESRKGALAALREFGNPTGLGTAGPSA